MRKCRDTSECGCQDLVERNVHTLAGLGIGTQLDGRAHHDRSVVIGGLGTLLGIPDEAMAVGNDSGRDGGTIVTTPADKHDAVLLDRGVAVHVLGVDFRVRVHDVGGILNKGL